MNDQDVPRQVNVSSARFERFRDTAVTQRLPRYDLEIKDSQFKVVRGTGSLDSPEATLVGL